MSGRGLALLLTALAACGGDGNGGGPLSLLPAQRSALSVTLRGCRPSVDHDLNAIVVKAAPDVARLYEAGAAAFPVGALVVKEQYADAACRRLVAFTLMKKEPPGYDPAHGDWHWQRLDAGGAVLDDGPIARCASCHTTCRARDFMCADP